ncbi:uncharacterized protein LOC121055229 [Oryza brachyantha]|uniref:uncharacterized protein LOC121055229 n=1 Tax=Oryza brachyantha TaxID=4533 RepID=UPI001ADB1B15|nr:uncharacterized protein LOC121055229 [Oryza brachyantha]
MAHKEKSFEEGEAMAAASSSPFFAHPSSLLRHVVHGCAGYLSGLCRSLQNLKPAAPSLKQDQADEKAVAVENVQISTRAVATPRRPLLREGNGGKGGAHHNAGF